MVVFGFTNFPGSVDEGQRFCKIRECVGPLDGYRFLEGPLWVYFREESKDVFTFKALLPRLAGRAAFISEWNVLNPKGGNRRCLWFLFPLFREVWSDASCLLVQRQGVLCRRCRRGVCEQ